MGLVVQGCSVVLQVLFIRKKVRHPDITFVEGNVLSLTELVLTFVTFSSAPHRFGLFFILTGYKTAGEIRDLLVLGAI